MQNDDTSMRVLNAEREPADDRTGVFTSGVMSTLEGGQIALYFSGRQHAGKNLGEVSQQRGELPGPIQMCDALSRNAPKLNAARRDCWLNCTGHGSLSMGAQFSGAMPLRAGGRGVRPRSRGARVANDTETAVAISSGTQLTGDDETACMAGGAVCRAQDRAEFRDRQGDQVAAESLAPIDAFPPYCWGGPR